MDKIMCVPRGVLFGEDNEHHFNGFQPLKDHDFIETIRENKRFLLRKKAGYFQPIPAEKDPNEKQIIPYLIFRHKNKIFLFKRLSGGGEKRLHDLYSIGLGGHINPIDDIEGADILESAIQREIGEEVKLGARYKKRLLGFINDDSNDVGKVHFGLLYLVDLNSPRISVSDDEKDVNEGSLIKVSDVVGYTEFMENWSRIAFNAVRKRK